MEFCYFRCPDEGTRSVILRGVYEAPERFAVRHFIHPSLPVIELGASIGVVSCLLNRRLRHPADHVVVEANPRVLPVLEENRARNRCRFEIVHGAVGAEGATTRISVGSGTLGSSLLLHAETYAEVPVVSLVGIVQRKGFKRFSVICDIEGAERRLIHDELSVLQSHVETLVIEFHPAINGPDEVANTQSLLQAHGFEPLWRQQDTVVYKNSALQEPAA